MSWTDNAESDETYGAARLNDRGRLTIPKGLRDDLHLDDGTEFAVVRDQRDICLVRRLPELETLARGGEWGTEALRRGRGDIRRDDDGMSDRRTLPGLNALAIQLIDDHPGHAYIAEEIGPALAGDGTLLVFGYLPLRVQWLLRDLGFGTVDARNAASSLLRYPIEFVDVDGETVLDAYGIGSRKNHDVDDCFYVALAREAGADRIITADRDFERLCGGEGFEYVNSVPEGVLERFHEVNG